MLDVITAQKAKEILECHFFDAFKNEITQIDISDCDGHILAEDIVANENLPAFNRSTVDGYAVIASDTFGCSESLPAMLKFAGKVNMGEHCNITLEKGQCVYVPTGGEVPDGADSMVMIEYVEDYNDGFRYIEKPTAPGQNMIFKCDEASIGDVMIEKGKQITPKLIGVMASLGYSKVKVYKKPLIGIISTGDELVPISENPDIGQIRDVNSYTLASLIRECGAEAKPYGIIKDDYDILKATVEKASSECDMLLISGGSSVGEKDSTAKILEEVSGSELLFHGLAVKPGKPTICADFNGKALFGLPGHPLASFFIFSVFVKPLLLNMAATDNLIKTAKATLASTIPSNHGREEIMPVKLTENGEAVPVYNKSGLISVLSDADGYIIIPRDCEGLLKEQTVEVILF